LRPICLEFSNDALRARGILPQLAPPERTPSPEPVVTKQDRLEAGDELDDDELLDLEDDLPASVLDSYRQARMREMQALRSTHRFNGMREISRDDYTREVTDASNAQIDGQHTGTGVVCFLYKDSCVATKRRPGANADVKCPGIPAAQKAPREALPAISRYKVCVHHWGPVYTQLSVCAACHFFWFDRCSETKTFRRYCSIGQAN
jgi:hypothetical protein